MDKICTKCGYHIYIVGRDAEFKGWCTCTIPILREPTMLEKLDADPLITLSFVTLDHSKSTK